MKKLTEKIHKFLTQDATTKTTTTWVAIIITGAIVVAMAVKVISEVF